MNADSNAMELIAVRIQDRANQFIAEQTKLQTLLAKLESTKAIQGKESDTNTSFRRNLLESTRSRHAVELEIYYVREEMNSHIEAIQALEKDTEELHGETQTVETKWEDDIKTIYAPHQSKIELYTRTIESARESRLARADKVRQRREQLERQIQRFNDEGNGFRCKSRDLKNEIEGMQEEELNRDAEISSIASHVQSALSKVSLLALKLLAISSKVVFDSCALTKHFNPNHSA